jgi:bifunctional non-homologous end joining protein LigD
VICSRRYGPAMWSLRPRTLPPGFIAPCLPTAASSAPSGDQWWHEIKHDGIRVIARKEDKRVKLYSRPGNDLTHRFPQIVEALARLRSRSCIIDGEAVACVDDGIALFQRIRYRRHDASVFMWAFDIIELNRDVCAASRSNGARRHLGGCLRTQGTVCSSTSTLKPKGRSSSSMRVARRRTPRRRQ